MNFKAISRRTLPLILVAATAILAACANTKLTSSWKDESLAKVPFAKVLVVFQNKDEGLRRALEDEMAKGIPNATPAYQVLSDAEIKDVKSAQAKVKSAGYDSTVIMRVVSVEKETSYVPGTMAMGPSPYGRMWGGGWGYGWNAAYDPGYLRTDKILTVGTTIYSSADDKLVWASQSETFNPDAMPKAVQDIVAANAAAVKQALGKK